MPTYNTAMINTDTTFHSYTQTGMSFNYVVGTNDTSYLISQGNATCTGKIIVQCVTQVQEVDGKLRFSLSPNPTAQAIQLDLPLFVNSIVLSNNIGLQQKVVIPEQHFLTIDVSDLSEGIYFLTIISGKQTSTRKFVIQH